MHGNLSSADARAIKSHGKSVSRNLDKAPENGPDDKSDADWFSQMCQALCANREGEKAWLPLHFLTGVDERTCQRYAAGHVKPPAYHLRALLRSEQGWQFLAFLMDGSGAQWWADVERARKIAAAIERAETE